MKMDVDTFLKVSTLAKIKKLLDD